MIKTLILSSAICVAAVASATPAAKSEYVALLKKGQVFAPIANSAVVGVVPVVDTDEVFPAAYVDDFKVDGDMTKLVWRKTKPTPALIDYRTAAKDVADFKSDIRVLYSKTAIYIGATLWQDMGQMVCKWDQHDMPIWNDDNIEVFLHVPSEKGNRLCQFVLNPINSLADLCDGNKAYWARGSKHATKRFDNRWSFELKIPFDGIPMDRPVAGDGIGIRFCRTVHAPKNVVGSSPALLGPGHGQRSRFAKLLFDRPCGDGAEKLIAEGDAYRREVLRRRFYERFFAAKARFNEVRGCAAAFATSKHPLHVRALEGVRQMKAALGAFEKKFAAELSERKAVPEADADDIIATFAGFQAYASKYAYMVWTADPWERGSPNDLPPDDAKLMPIDILFEQAGNEREAVCLNISGILCGSRLDLRLHLQSVARTKTAPFLSTDNFEIYSEPFVRFGGDVITAPHVRSPGNMITVSPGKTVRVWVMFNSRGVAAGDYSTRMAFKSATDLVVSDRDVPVCVRVWKFDLPETRNWPIKGFFWASWSFVEDEVALLELTHDYHVTHGWTQFHRYRYGMYDDFGWYPCPDKGKGRVDKSHDFEDEYALHGNEAFLRRAKELGMRFVIGWGTPLSLDWYKTITKRFLDMGFSYEDFIYKGLLRDEFAKKDIPIEAAEREAVWNWNTNLYFQATYLSSPPPTGATMDDIESAKLPEFYKMWTVISGRCKDPKEGPDTIGRLKKKGCKVWEYQCSQFMQERGILDYYRFFPWDAYMRGLEGLAFWTVYSPSGDDGWDSRDGYDEGLCWRGLDKKPIPTKMLEAVREGLEDVAYMDALKKALVRVEEVAEGSRPPDALIAKAKSLLAEREAVIKAKDQQRVDAWRLAVGRVVDCLVRHVDIGK